MRILLVVHGFPPSERGGTELYVDALARSLASRGDEVFVLAREGDAARPEYALRQEERGDLRIGWINHTYREDASFADTYAGRQIVGAVRPWLDRIEPEVAHVHHLTGLSIELLVEFSARRLPTVVTLHDFWMMCHRGQLVDLDLKLCAGPLPAGCARCLGAVAAPPSAYRAVSRMSRVPGLRRLARRLGPEAGEALQRRASLERAQRMQSRLRLAELLLAPSQAIADRFTAFGVAPERLRRHELGIDLAPVHERPARRAPDGVLRVGFFGALLPSKAPHVALAACAGLPAGRWELRVFGGHASYHGDDRYGASLAPLLARREVSLREVPHERVAAELAELDVVVVPSIWPETSLVAREAFAAGVPVVASAIGGVGDLVEDGKSGLLVPPGDAVALQAALRRLLTEDGLLERLRAGIPAVRGIEDDVEATRLLYREVRAAGAARSSPRLAAVVLNYRTPQDALLAVRSLQASRRPVDEIVVVDNASDDGSAEWLRARLVGAMLIETESNLGFSGGVNRGVRAALANGAELVAIANADVVLAPDALGALESALAADAAAGIAGPLVLARAFPDRIGSAGIRWRRRTGRMRQRLAGDPVAEAGPETEAVDGVEASAMLVRREVFERAGLFDERYFFGFEDLELCLRAGRAGFATLVVGAARAYHQGAATLAANSPQRLYYGARNQLLLAEEAAPGGRLGRAARAAMVLAWNVAHALVSSPVAPLAGLRAVAAGARDHRRRRYGPRKD